MKVKVVAELSANHQGSLERAKMLVVAAAQAGAWGVKLQTWDPQRMVVDPSYTLRSGPWAGRNLAHLYEQARTPLEWHEPLFSLARELGLEPFSSVFDTPSLLFLEELGCPRYKIASFELVDLPLIRRVALTKKPMILSTGMATRPEIDDAYQAAYSSGARDITLLKCTSAYPAKPEDVNLRTMLHMRGRYGTAICQVGLSDHTRGLAAAVVAAGMGATMIEKHLTMRRDEGGLDAEFSAEPDELRQLCEEVERAAVAPGDVVYGPSQAEAPQVELRRSLYFSRDLQPGEPITHDAICSARPAQGVGPGKMGRILTMYAARPVRRGEPVTWDAVSEQKPAPID